MPERRAILVDCITLHHHYRGWLRSNSRLSDELSDSRSTSLVLKDVQITVAGHKAPSLECSELTLQKENILIAMPQSSRDASPGQRLSKFQKRDRHGAVIVLPGHLMSGVMQLPKASVAWCVLKESGLLQPFIGLTNVTVHNAVFRLTPQQCPVAIVQRDAVEAIELTSMPLQEAAPIELSVEQGIEAVDGQASDLTVRYE